MSAVRLLRAVLVTSLIWAIAWAPFSVVLEYSVWYFAGNHESMHAASPPLRLPLLRAGVWVVWGATNGVVCAMALMSRARFHDLGEISIRQTALWGALAALGLPLLALTADLIDGGPHALDKVGGVWTAIAMLCVAAALGAGLAAGTLHLARRGLIDVTAGERPPPSVER